MPSNPEKYKNTVNYLYGLQKHGIKLGLSNTNELMRILGEPHHTFRSIHIAGTNGKGSTASMIASILRESGFKTGLFTSPHLISFTERIRINNRQISESEVISLASRIRNSISDGDLNPTFFEVVTAMAFQYFAENHLEWAVIETGMGGRLDATNVVRPEVTIITNISLDHCEFLGYSISKITDEKAGIIKQGVPLVTASLDPQVVDRLSTRAKDLNSAIHVYGEHFKGRLTHMDDAHITIDYTGDDQFNDMIIPLSGKYQLYNACLAIRASELLKREGVSISGPSIRNGLQTVTLEGRLEWVSHSPPILLDGAHNPDASRSLADSIKDLFPDRKIILIAGVMNDKDIKEIMGPLMEIAGHIILTKAEYERAASSIKIRGIVSSLQHSDVTGNEAFITNTSSVSEALHLAESLCLGDEIILITGSFYTTGEAKELLGHDAVLSKLRE